MKMKVALIVLGLVCLGLALGLITSNKQAQDTEAELTKDVLYNSNQWVVASTNLAEQQEVNRKDQQDLAERRDDITALSNNLDTANGDLSKTRDELKTALEETAKRDAKIADLETQNEHLDKQATDLRGSITDLEDKITTTQKALDASEGDKAFLEKELKRLMAEKAELERQFNDLSVMRAQVRKLKEELSIARRLEWIREGIFANADMKGAQKLMQNSAAGNTAASQTNKYDLNVEVNADGTVKVIAPINTNNPPATNQPVPP